MSISYGYYHVNIRNSRKMIKFIKISLTFVLIQNCFSMRQLQNSRINSLLNKERFKKPVKKMDLQVKYPEIHTITEEAIAKFSDKFIVKQGTIQKAC